jgi:SNF2 family DNA or RNA helicase
MNDFPQFEDAKRNSDGSLRFSESVLTPVLRIEATDGNFKCELFGKRVVRGDALFIKAESLEHNWVNDEGIARPLPPQTPELILTELGLAPAVAPSFKQVAAIDRGDYDWIEVDVNPNVWEAFESSAEIMNCPIPGLKADLYPYQSLGVAWMRRTLLARGGLILADEMGLGKTLQLIALLLLFREDCPAKALVVCPTSLLVNWQREIFRFAPHLSVLIHRGANRAGLASHLTEVDVVLTTYDTVIQDTPLLRSIDFEWVICDEAQAVKNPDSKRRQALSELRTNFLIPVTGTPVETSLTDLWSLIDLSIRGLLGSQAEFESKYQSDIESAEELSKYVDALILRRSVIDVASDLPERRDIRVPVELPKDLADLYERVRLDALQEFERSGALVASTRLELLAAHPWILDYGPESEFWQSIDPALLQPGSESLTPKLEVTLKLLEQSFAIGKKVLLFSRYNRVFPIMRALFSGRGQFYLNQINGATETEDRQKIVDEFSNVNGPALLVLNPKAAGAGLNITAATVVIHYTQYWNPALDMQASARAHRRGQTEPVNIYRIFYTNTIDEVMLQRSNDRRELGDKILEVAGVDDSEIARALQMSPINGGG